MFLVSIQYATTDEAQATRTALHGLKWPPSNPKVLSVDFSQQDEVGAQPKSQDVCLPTWAHVAF